MKIGSREFRFSENSAVMGILNVTPDSFSDGGCFDSHPAALEQAKRMAADGADIIDVGGESTRPGSDRVSLEDELARVIPVIEALASSLSVTISIDTTKAAVAKAAIEAGASLVNDISSMTFDPEMASVVADSGLPVVLMHTADDPKVMQKTYHYEDVVADISRFFEVRIQAAIETGISRERIILDPGIGFGKSLAHNLDLIRRCSRFAELGCPVMMGPSRKSFIGTVLDLPVEDRLEGTLAAVAVSVMEGANILRVHDVKETYRVCRMCDAILGRGPAS